MWARKRIDIGWTDLWFGFRKTYCKVDRTIAAQDAESAFTPRDRSLACLSVRSGFDLLLTGLRMPAGSEVLVSAVTILDMVRIIESHDLIAVPIDIDPSTMQLDLGTLQNAIKPQTRAILVAHLFGAILDLSEICSIAQRNDLLLIEDCAQCFDGNRYTGHPGSDVVMFSFGPIKTSTALAGALLVVRDQTLLKRMKSTHQTWPIQPQAEFRVRVRTYSLLKLASGRRTFAILVWILRWLGKNRDETLNGAVRNFPADQFFTRRRRQPCNALLQLMKHRIDRFDASRQDRRSRLGRMLADGIGLSDRDDNMRVPSAATQYHTWWVFPLCCDERHQLIEQLRYSGFDATAVSQMQAVPSIVGNLADSPVTAQRLVDSMCFLPLYPEMSEQAISQMIKIVDQHAKTRNQPFQADSPLE
ncbi:DegT/DnrJ/EryC1/StrS family aminotransferase [Stieleria varia]|uniref:DegT/DnrJ/EryC1/StrS family aminotransferase n=1 Tax=Stieleria varia TaxID=2528005 RepID=UPI0011B79D66|nr:DegT/DnrJ/EryC1/StrS family aminotransferase [Stieleria varia]